MEIAWARLSVDESPAERGMAICVPKFDEEKMFARGGGACATRSDESRVTSDEWGRAGTPGRGDTGTDKKAPMGEKGRGRRAA